MFNFFKPKFYKDSQLGTLTWSRGYWRGSLNVHSHGIIPIMLSGNRSQPENLAITLATEFSSTYFAVKAAIEASLFEHYQPYKEEVNNGELDGDDDLLLEIKKSKDIWQYVEMKYILFEKLSGTMTTEIAYTTDWDIEHTLGARLVNGKLLELCGSV